MEESGGLIPVTQPWVILQSPGQFNLQKVPVHPFKNRYKPDSAGHYFKYLHIVIPYKRVASFPRLASGYNRD